MNNQSANANAFLALHHQKSMFLLPNAWNAATALLYEELGFPAVATTSAGIAFSMGYPDGEVMPFEEMLYVIRRIVQAVQVPVTADIVAGFAHSSDELAANIRKILEAGVVGINFEDGRADGTLLDMAQNISRIQVIRQVANEQQIALVINARVDTYWLGGGKGDFADTVERAKAYLAAGADCIFVPSLTDAGEIARLRAQIDGPINLLAAGMDPKELAALGIERLSLGSLPFRTALGYLQQITKQAKEHGDLSQFGMNAVGFSTLMDWFG